MANFGGHAIPGSFFLLFGLWLTVKHTLQRYWRKNQLNGRALLPPFFKRMDYIEGGLQIFASFVGIMVEQFVVDGPHARLYDAHNHSWVKLMNWQHATMYLFFGISGIALVVSTVSKMVPVGVDRLALSLALFVEGFLFYYHVHSRPPLDAHIHSLLLVAVFSGSASTMLEVFMRDRFILEMLKAVLFILQGSWFYQIGFVLYPPSGPQWDLTLHNNIMFVTMCFCWHLALALFVATCISTAVWIATRRMSRRAGDIEMVMRKKSSTANSEKALLEESEEE
ncbi:transmembrane protein 45B [Hippocampus zosterae]|uniref:transmembrane protein 45B n=1 Tax=Hippocampus zosterae TaxID=109293 RepID=UPI00223D6A9E|nr:transmembrane protein 45B [Hippocampus zosterae]XP_051902751.1 transmembrane protein 45B [Hippocampus zosterae]XP_051902752.1 transmembrane protein 45B [Hippocampus zosterae]XP_051902753.1 transmembrane protein 45B [Hippocampus zosterae]